MRNILTKLQSLKDNPEQSGILSDLDGTLSRIAPTPSEAIITGKIKELLRRLAEIYGVVGVISGRDSDEAKNIVGLEELIYFGNHGLEWVEDGRQHYSPEATEFLHMAPELEAEILKNLGRKDFVVEKKRLGVAIHYRLTEDKESAREKINNVIGLLLGAYPLKKSEGRYVVELKPDLPVNKGYAVRFIVLNKNIDKAVYLGDDITDIDAFKALKDLSREKPFQGISIGINSAEASAKVIEEADYSLKSINEVEDLLSWLI